MRLLLDTHALYWWLYFPERLSSAVRSRIADADTVIVSAVTAYEMSNKHRLGKWPEIEALVVNFERIVSEQDFGFLPVSIRHALRAGVYQNDHRDPFDRMLAAQAQMESLTLVSNDERLTAFGVSIAWD